MLSKRSIDRSVHIHAHRTVLPLPCLRIYVRLPYMGRMLTQTSSRSHELLQKQQEEEEILGARIGDFCGDRVNNPDPYHNCLPTSLGVCDMGIPFCRFHSPVHYPIRNRNRAEAIRMEGRRSEEAQNRTTGRRGRP